MIKRLFDLFVALTFVLLFWPIFLILFILVKVKLGGDALFVQPRPGLNGKVFNMVKFRTMTDERDKQGNLLPDEKRMTKFGQLLRSTSLDELPELFNVLKGDMSLVGPRPLLVEYLDKYSQEQARRHQVRPGITGYAQVNGRNAVSWQERFAMDVWYVDNQSFWLDIKILLQTVKTVVKKDGVSQEGHVTMEPFKGQSVKDQDNEQ